jgi:hypothetical protein
MSTTFPSDIATKAGYISPMVPFCILLLVDSVEEV